ncbi:hypothetical protein Tco_0795210 [Tanacetum coccineum]
MAQRKKRGSKLQAEEFGFEWLLQSNLDEIEEVNANCILMANLQQASTSGTQTDNAPVYDSGRTQLRSGERVDQQPATVELNTSQKKKLKSDFKIREDELLDKQIQLENKIKELDNILVKTGEKQHSLYNGKVLLEKHDPPVVHDSEETLQLAQRVAKK